LYVAEIDERCGDERSQPEQGNNTEREPDLPAQVWRTEDPRKSRSGPPSFRRPVLTNVDSR
jgi:hypothetical protein